MVKSIVERVVVMENCMGMKTMILDSIFIARVD